MITGDITESDIYRTCVILSLIGLGVIHLSHSYMEPDEADIRDIDETWIGNTIQIDGSTHVSADTGSATFLEIQDSTGSIQGVDFDNRSMPGAALITGYVDVYEGDLQIVIQDIEAAN